jgi:carboxyl-terminal processing protease
VVIATILILSACGGGGGGGSSAPVSTPSSPTDNTPGSGGGASAFTPDVFLPFAEFQASCANPRTGLDQSGRGFPDSLGSTIDENNWLRSWSNDLYLWYSEILDVDPADHSTEEYFDLMKTFEITPSGALRDKFHFTIATDDYQALAQSGVSAGYGMSLALISRSPPRQIVVAYTEPGTPATSESANLIRGTRILNVDGIDVTNGSDVDALNAGLFPSEIGQSHEFLVQDPGANEQRTILLESASITSTPVQNVGTVSTETGEVGYILFNDHIATSEAGLINAINQLKTKNIADLVLDLRYNGGGFLDIANELAFMIAGPQLAEGAIFEELKFNDKHPTFDPVTDRLLSPMLFHTSSRGFSVGAGQPLPFLNLSRVFVITGPGTCSASESIINGLRGVDVEVIQIGSTTCGKPYGFYPFDNCGTTYFSIQFKGVNSKGFGDYTDGFSPANLPSTQGTEIPGCSIADDFIHQLGDPDEARFAAALAYRLDGSCPSTSLASRASRHPLSAVNGQLVKSVWLRNRIMRH